MTAIVQFSSKCRAPPINHHPTIAPPSRSKSSGNTIGTGYLNQNPPSSAHVSLSAGSWKSLPSSAHATAQKKRPSHTSSKKRRPIGSVASVTLKLCPRAGPIKNPSFTPRETIAAWLGISNKSATQPRHPPSPNIDHLAKAHPLAQRPIKQPSSWLSNQGRPSAQSPLSMTQFFSQTSSKMVTRQGTDQSVHANQIQEKHEAELALQKKMEEEWVKCQ